MTAFSLDEPMGEDWRRASLAPSGRLVHDAGRPTATAEARQEMDQAIAELPETLRSTFVLRDIQGLSGAETAEVLGITVQAVKNRLHRARLQLRETVVRLFCRARQGSAGHSVERKYRAN